MHRMAVLRQEAGRTAGETVQHRLVDVLVRGRIRVRIGPGTDGGGARPAVPARVGRSGSVDGHGTPLRGRRDIYADHGVQGRQIRLMARRSRQGGGARRTWSYRAVKGRAESAKSSRTRWHGSAAVNSGCHHPPPGTHPKVAPTGRLGDDAHGNARHLPRPRRRTAGEAPIGEHHPAATARARLRRRRGGPGTIPHIGRTHWPDATITAGGSGPSAPVTANRLRPPVFSLAS